jgi:protein gp37
MAERSAIEWTQATWNPVTGCTKVLVGCDHCYAETFAERFRGVPGHPYEQGSICGCGQHGWTCPHH